MTPVGTKQDAIKRIQLTKCEVEVMDIVWRKGCVTVNDVVDEIGRDLAYTTVMTTIKILEEKQIVERGGKIGRAYTYRPLVTRAEVREGMIRELADRLFGGSVQSLAISLINFEDVSREDLAALKQAATQLDKS